MEKSELLKNIQVFKKEIQYYKKLLLESRDRIMPDIVRNHDLIAKTRSELTSKYAGLEKYIKRIGKNPRMNDGVWNVVYSPYDNAFSADILLRTGPSLDAVLQDLDYIIGKLSSMKQNELDELFGSPQKREMSNDLITKMKSLMTEVSTGQAKIQDKNEEYQNLYSQLDEQFEANGIENPNEFSDLWEFYNYWSKNLPHYADRRTFVIDLYKKKKVKSILKSNYHLYINAQRIQELKNCECKVFDLTKLIKYCEEINMSFNNGCLFSVLTLVRAILDHVPPIFNCSKFSNVSNNYNGSKSFKESMQNLNKSSRKIADSFLHTQIRDKEVLPNATQIDFSNDIDVLLSEIVRLLK